METTKEMTTPAQSSFLLMTRERNGETMDGERSGQGGYRA